MTKHLAATLLTALSMTAAPFILAPTAQAEVCGGVGGRYVDVGGCSHVGADIADAAIVGAEVDRPYGYPDPIIPGPVGLPGLPLGGLAFPSFPGELPCFTPLGVSYYTPGNEPCFAL